MSPKPLLNPPDSAEPSEQPAAHIEIKTTEESRGYERTTFYNARRASFRTFVLVSDGYEFVRYFIPP